MKTTILILFAFISVACSSQDITYGRFSLGSNTTGTSSIALGAYALVVQPKFEPKKILAYDTVKCIAIYIDGDGLVKGESCLKISKATVTKMQYYPPEPCNYYSNMGGGNNSMVGTCAVFHYGTHKEEPDLQLFRVVTISHKEIPLQSIIQYK